MTPIPTLLVWKSNQHPHLLSTFPPLGLPARRPIGSQLPSITVRQGHRLARRPGGLACNFYKSLVVILNKGCKSRYRGLPIPMNRIVCQTRHNKKMIFQRVITEMLPSRCRIHSLPVSRKASSGGRSQDRLISARRARAKVHRTSAWCESSSSSP
jgi:hypothetical protein